VLIEENARRRAAAKQHIQSYLPKFERLTPHIFAVELEQVERIHEHAAIGFPTSDQLKTGNAIRPARDCFAIENACTRSQLCHGLDNQGKAFGQIIAGAAVGPHPFADLAGDYPKAVMLDFVQPFIPAGWGFRASRKAWRDKTRRQSTETRRHSPLNRITLPPWLVGFPKDAAAPGQVAFGRGPLGIWS
jgi:hypothetical protein